MPLPSSGPLSMSQINAEFGRGNNLNSYRGTTYYTSGGGPFTFPSGAISFSNFYGTQATSPLFSFTISSHIDQANLRSLAVAAGWNQSSPVIATLTAGYYLYSSNTGAPALTINGSWPGGVTFVNNGYVMGMGGKGGGSFYNGAYTYNYLISAGGPAISLGVSCTIQNNSYIGGGGGGGGGVNSNVGNGGGGAGGGAGGDQINANTGTNYYGGAGGGIGASGASGAATGACGGGGGRIMPGSNITLTTTQTGSAVLVSTGGGGGNAGSASYSGTPTTFGTPTGGLGGSGGGTGGEYALFYSTASFYSGGGGGGWGASGGTSASNIGTQSGAAGGKCVNLNGYSLTWSATGTRYGAIS